MTKKLNKSQEYIPDGHDISVLNECIDNPKIPLRELGKKLKISFVTVMNRIKRLEKEGIIKKYTTRVNYDKLGYGIHAIIEVRISKGRFSEFAKALEKEPNIYKVYDTTGEFDSTLIGRFKTPKAMDKFLKKIQSCDFVERTYTKLILNTIKDEAMKI